MQKSFPRVGPAVAALAATVALAGCANMNIPGLGSGKSETAAAPAAAPAAPKIGPGMNAQGEVTDPKKVEAGYGQKVKGLNDWEGEITGKPAPGSKFTQLKIGMPLKQVMDLVGTPTDQGAYVTGKAWIPFNFGSDRYRHEVVYKGQGRLVFAGSAGFDSNAHLIWIIHSANEQGYR
jgi:hypothetical protein